MKTVPFFWSLLACFVLSLFSSEARAQALIDDGKEEMGKAEKAFWIGLYEPDRPEDALEVGFDVTLARDLFKGIRLQFGGLVTTDESFYGFGGLRYSLPLGCENWRIDISSAVGLFEEGNGKDLGGVVEFRSGLDLMHRLENGNFLSLAIYHISNSGIYDSNPGSNTLLLRWVF